jgi:periplasmic divalent cation tolerance protein
VTTYPSTEAAEKSAHEAVNRRLAACVTLSRVNSVYRWKGEIVEDEECLVLYKTTKEKKDMLSSFIKENHPYEVPEIVTFSGEVLNEEYHKWLRECTT